MSPARPFFTGVSRDFDGNCSNPAMKAVWQRLCMLIEDLPALVDLRWDCSWPMHLCIDHVIRARPSLRPHLDTFWFAHCSGFAEGDGVKALTLLRTNNPHSIRARSVGCRVDGSTDDTFEAALALVTGATCAIRDVAFLTDRIPGYYGPLQIGALRDREQRIARSGFVQALSSSTDRAALRSLETGDTYTPEAHFFGDVFENCRLAQLRVLELHVS